VRVLAGARRQRRMVWGVSGRDHRQHSPEHRLRAAGGRFVRRHGADLPCVRRSKTHRTGRLRDVQKSPSASSPLCPRPIRRRLSVSRISDYLTNKSAAAGPADNIAAAEVSGDSVVTRSPHRHRPPCFQMSNGIWRRASASTRNCAAFVPKASR
jgi:hypothetical protein